MHRDPLPRWHMVLMPRRRLEITKKRAIEDGGWKIEDEERREKGGMWKEGMACFSRRILRCLWCKW